MIHAEDERSFDTALRGMAYPLTTHRLSIWISIIAGMNRHGADRTPVNLKIAFKRVIGTRTTSRVEL